MIQLTESKLTWCQLFHWEMLMDCKNSKSWWYQGPIVSGHVFISWSNTSNSACCFGEALILSPSAVQKLARHNRPLPKTRILWFNVGMRNKSYQVIFLINASNNETYVVKWPTWAESKSDSLCILVYCLFANWIFAIIFFIQSRGTQKFLFVHLLPKKIITRYKI